MSDLPIESVLPALRAELGRNANVVLQAPPGAGKTTRVPLALLEEPWLVGQRVIMLEPRRLAARNVAAWMADRLGQAVGETVGYRIHLDTRVSAKTRIEIVTEGVLVRMLQADAALDGVGLVIFDEFHERNLHADVGLALCLDVQQGLRAELRLLVMSATLDTAAVSTLLGDAPVLTCAGRAFPVTTHYFPATAERIDQAVADAVVQALREEAGSVLAFLPGGGEIRQAAALLRERLADSRVTVLPLYGELPREAQEQAIAPAAPGTRKVVLATSIAETSLTIEGVRVVIDSGWSRVPRFDPRAAMTRLATVRVSQASADQRRGRAGRIEPGVCYRLWPEAAQRTLPPHSVPEILEADLAPLALELARWGVEDPRRLSWIDPPPAAAYAQARGLLTALGALDAHGRITAHGHAMAELGAHPRLAHMMLRARDADLGVAGCRLAALLAERDIVKGTLRDSDMRIRLEALDLTRREGPVDRAAATRVLKAARLWQQRLGIAEAKGDAQSAGVLLAWAYPDRIAQRRPGFAPRYRLASGRGAVLAETDSLAREPYLVAADLDAGEREARIFLAAPIAEDAIEAACAATITSLEFVVWDEAEQAVAARRQRRLGELVLREERLAAADPHAVITALLQGLRARGIDALPWTAATRNWQARVLLLRRMGVPHPIVWPDVSDVALAARYEDWLAPFLSGITRIADLQRLDLGATLTALLTWQQRQALDELTPTHVVVPSGSRLPLDYTHGEVPVLAVRLQEMFGLPDTPRIAGGALPLMLHLLSPAHRPVQVTRDLASFWRSAYHEVKKDLKGRYPKHYWPDDPLQAQPTHRAKPRS